MNEISGQPTGALLDIENIITSGSAGQNLTCITARYSLGLSFGLQTSVNSQAQKPLGGQVPAEKEPASLLQ